MTKTVGTHNGVFHADESMAVAILKMVFGDLTLVRTRNEEELKKCDVLVDVGGVYDQTAERYDHHQRGGAGIRENGIPYSSAGLVWAAYGPNICLARSGKGSETAKIWQRVDEELIQAIDASDCGVQLRDGEPKFKTAAGDPLLGVSYSSFISSLNPEWDPKPASADFDRQFNTAVDIAYLALSRALVRAEAASKAESLVKEAMAQATDHRVIVLDRFCPWGDAVFSTGSKALFVVFPSESGEWMLQCIPPTKGSFEKRLPLPETWAGLRGADLAALIGIEDAIFCHPGRFIAGAKTKESVLKMAELALRHT